MLSNRYALGETFTLPSLQAVRYRSHLRERESGVFGESIVGRRNREKRKYEKKENQKITFIVTSTRS